MWNHVCKRVCLCVSLRGHRLYRMSWAVTRSGCRSLNLCQRSAHWQKSWRMRCWRWCRVCSKGSRYPTFSNARELSQTLLVFAQQSREAHAMINTENIINKINTERYTEYQKERRNEMKLKSKKNAYYMCNISFIFV